MKTRSLAWNLFPLFIPVLILGVFAVGNSLIFFDGSGSSMGVKLVLNDVSKDHKTGGYFASLDLVNSAAVPVSYTGYSPSAPLHSRKSLSFWVKHKESSTWCGTGASTYVCPANSRCNFKISLGNTPGPVQISIGVRMQGASSYFQIRSPQMVVGL